ncbi:MAG: ankyrin repeat domain-containing protein [Planctomycetota bacterium]
MKLSLPLKLGVFVILFFGAVIVTCLLWTPAQIFFHLRKLNMGGPREQMEAVDSLFRMGEKGITAIESGYRDGRDAAVFLIANWPANNGNNADTPGSRCTLPDGYGKKHIGTIKLLIEIGVDINSRDSRDATLLHRAAKRGDGSFAKYVLERGADFDARDVEMRTPLHLAAIWNKPGIARLLISNGARSDIIDKRGDTPLHYAAHDGYFELVRLLVENHADMNIAGKFGVTPVDIAFMEEYKDIFSYLRARGGKFRWEFSVPNAAPRRAVNKRGPKRAPRPRGQQ